MKKSKTYKYDERAGVYADDKILITTVTITPDNSSTVAIDILTPNNNYPFLRGTIHDVMRSLFCLVKGTLQNVDMSDKRINDNADISKLDFLSEPERLGLVCSGVFEWLENINDNEGKTT